jgi:hypothetical protein
MPQISLPSGRVVMIRSEGPTYGELVHCTSLGLDKGTEAFTYARFKLMVPSLKRRQIKALSVADGAALAAEVLKIWEGSGSVDGN